jgi:hypothetical protein
MSKSKADIIESYRVQLSREEKKIFDAILLSFPATDPASAFNKAIEGGCNFQFICK